MASTSRRTSTSDANHAFPRKQVLRQPAVRFIGPPSASACAALLMPGPATLALRRPQHSTCTAKHAGNAQNV